MALAQHQGADGLSTVVSAPLGIQLHGSGGVILGHPMYGIRVLGAEARRLGRVSSAGLWRVELLGYQHHQTGMARSIA
jgi:hypothetical protein